MKNLMAILLVVTVFTGLSMAQYKGYDDKGPSNYNTSGNLLLGFINPKNFTMNHSFNVSMVNTRSGSVSLTSYVNTMNYSFSKNLNVSADVKVQYSPYASSSLGAGYSSALQKNLSGVFLSRASVNYQISDNAFINFEYRRLDETDYYNNFWDPYNSNGYNGYSGFGLR
ncbi:MAG: hypothetical protein IPL67_03790 [Ignavibacteria bacterium]|jgi:hypothetical protein|nr:hypothetical protein [Ignavibacteria bacterium]